MELIKKVKSKISDVTKYVFLYKEKYYVEFSYINKHDGKHIICVPCQTMCSQRCVFCHTNDYIGKIKEENISYSAIVNGVTDIIADQNLSDNLLISYMGCGEPLLNMYNVKSSIIELYFLYGDKIRFALATSLPKGFIVELISLANTMEQNNINLKVHLSLHHTYDIERKKLMPHSSLIDESLAALFLYNVITNNPIELHYTLIEGVNDSKIDMFNLSNLFIFNNIDEICDVKFLYYNKRDGIDFVVSPEYHYRKYDTFEPLENAGIDFEFYMPPGLDIGASCGQFNFEVKS